MKRAPCPLVIATSGLVIDADVTRVWPVPGRCLVGDDGRCKDQFRAGAATALALLSDLAQNRLMSLALLKSRALSGMHAHEVTVEVHLANGLPGFSIVGLPDVEVKESKDRVRAAILNSGFEFPSRRITVNLAPADLPKESGRFDLPMALGILAASEQIPASRLGDHEYAGELSLSGELRPVRGALAMTLAVARGAGGLARARGFILPAANADEATLVQGALVLPAHSLVEVCAHLAGHTALMPHPCPARPSQPDYPDLADVKGQAQARRALEIAAAGGHSLLLVGPPGTGKSLLATRFAGLLPPLTDDEALESAALLSAAGLFRPERWRARVVRAPHHTASAVALVGGGATPRPGEISLAHHGVLFLDELPEFERRVLEVLREPLETGHITISRAARQADFPARFQLVAAMNPCPCGWLGHPQRACRCTPEAVDRYQARISGPLLDRIDLQVEVAPLEHEEIATAAAGESSTPVAARAAAARAVQLARQGKPNARLGNAEIDALCAPDPAGARLLQSAMTRFAWSARSYHRILKVARSAADLAGSASVRAADVAEAIQLRRGLRRG